MAFFWTVWCFPFSRFSLLFCGDCVTEKCPKSNGAFRDRIKKHPNAKLPHFVQGNLPCSCQRREDGGAFDEHFSHCTLNRFEENRVWRVKLRLKREKESVKNWFSNKDLLEKFWKRKRKTSTSFQTRRTSRISVTRRLRFPLSFPNLLGIEIVNARFPIARSRGFVLHPIELILWNQNGRSGKKFNQSINQSTSRLLPLNLSYQINQSSDIDFTYKNAGDLINQSIDWTNGTLNSPQEEQWRWRRVVNSERQCPPRGSKVSPTTKYRWKNASKFVSSVERKQKSHVQLSACAPSAPCCQRNWAPALPRPGARLSAAATTVATLPLRMRPDRVLFPVDWAVARPLRAKFHPNTKQSHSFPAIILEIYTTCYFYQFIQRDISK